MNREITVAMASIPSRETGMLEVVREMLPQCDRLCLYLNNYEEIPKELPKSEKLTIVLAGQGKQYPDRGSQGKHFWLDAYPDDYYLTVDDDIFYPADYTARMVQAIEKYSRKAIITVHGTSYRLDAAGNIPGHDLDRAHKLYHNYSKKCAGDIYVHCCGNGCTGFCPAELGMTCAVTKGQLHSGDDGDIALFAQANSIPIVRMATDANWLTANEKIWPIEAQHKDIDKLKLQNLKARSWKQPWRLFPGQIAPISTDPPSKDAPIITVSMTTCNTPNDLLRRAVDSVLGQTERRIKLFVVNDAGDRSCWDALADISDARLTRIDMPVNAGTYACHAETLRRCETRWWSPHDSDDYVLPDRYATVLKAAETAGDGADVVLGGYTNVDMDGNATVMMPHKTPAQSKVARRITYVSVWAGGLWRTSWLRQAGGINGNFRVGYDSALQTIALAFARIFVAFDAGYIRLRRPESLTLDPATGFYSDYRKNVYRCVDDLLERALKAPDVKAAGKIMSKGNPL